MAAEDGSKRNSDADDEASSREKGPLRRQGSNPKESKKTRNDNERQPRESRGTAKQNPPPREETEAPRACDVTSPRWGRSG